MTNNIEFEYDLGVVGLGYVGLPLCLGFAESGVAVIGLDVDLEKTSKINVGSSYIKHIGNNDIRHAIKSGNLEASTTFSKSS